MMRKFFRKLWQRIYGCAGCDNCTPFVPTTKTCLGKMNPGQLGVISEISTDSTTKRLQDMGLIVGTKVTVIKTLGPAMEVHFRGSHLVITKKEVYHFMVELTSVQDKVQCDTSLVQGA